MDKQFPEAALDFVYDLEQYDKTFSLTSHLQHTLHSKVQKTSPEREPLSKNYFASIQTSYFFVLKFIPLFSFPQTAQ